MRSFKKSAWTIVASSGRSNSALPAKARITEFEVLRRTKSFADPLKIEATISYGSCQYHDTDKLQCRRIGNRQQRKCLVSSDVRVTHCGIYAYERTNRHKDEAPRKLRLLWKRKRWLRRSKGKPNAQHARVSWTISGRHSIWKTARPKSSPLIRRLAEAWDYFWKY